MPTSPDPQPSQQTQAGGETFREQPQWCSPQPHSHRSATASFSGQSQLCQVPHAGELGVPHKESLQDSCERLPRECPQVVLCCSAPTWAWFLCLILGSTCKVRGLGRESSADFESSHTAVGLNVWVMFPGTILWIGFCCKIKAHVSGILLQN